MHTRTRAIVTLASALAILATSPTALSALTGSGQVSDVVRLTTVVGSIAGSAMTSADGSPAASSSAFHAHNSNSNVNTYIRYTWSTTPYYGPTTTDTTISIRGTTHAISDLLWFKQESVSGAGVTTTSESFTPLLLANSASIATVTWTSAGNACTGWTGSPAGGFSATSAGSFTFRYHAASAPVDDTPATSDAFYYCLDTTNSKIYLAKSTVFGSATLLSLYTRNSGIASVQTYAYEFLSGAQAEGNTYCMTGVTGSGTSATPDLAQCQALTYSRSGSAASKMQPLFDPPAYFPSVNQAGGSSAVTYALTGTQWNPYAYTTTNSA